MARCEIELLVLFELPEIYPRISSAQISKQFIRETSNLF